MISKQYFEETFSLATAQALQTWANDNLIVIGQGNYAMQIAYSVTDETFAETEVTGLTIGNEYTLTTDTVSAYVNRYRTKINSSPNDNTSMVAELGYGTGIRTLLFTATAETMYIAIGDEAAGNNGLFKIVVDNVSLKIDGVEAVTNGTFEGNNTTGWYAQNGNATLSVYEYDPVAPPSGDNEYLVSINVPEYDSGNPAHVRIPTDQPYTNATFNNASFTSFYMEPGFVSTSAITITTSGTAVSRRYISLHNASDLHPAQLPENELASFRLVFSGASYWTVDRMCTLDVDNFNVILQYGSTDNIFNRMYQRGFQIGLWLKNNSDNTVIQNSRFTNMSFNGFQYDLSCIQIVEQDDTNVVFNCRHVRIINNEFVDSKPGRANRYYGSQGNYGQEVDFTDMIFDSNTVEYTDAIRTDGNGNLDPNGDYCTAEATTFTLKGGSKDSNLPVLVTRNHIWGSRPADPSMEEISSVGGGPMAYMGARYAHFKNNVVFDGTRGLALSDRYDDDYGSYYAEIEDNLMVDCGARPSTYNAPCLQIGQGYFATVQNNTMVRPIGAWAKVWYNFEGCSVSYNTVVQVDGTIYTEGNNATVEMVGNVELTGTPESNGYTEDYTFTTDKFTNSPRVVTVLNCIKP